VVYILEIGREFWHKESESGAKKHKKGGPNNLIQFVRGHLLQYIHLVYPNGRELDWKMVVFHIDHIEAITFREFHG